MLGEIDLVLILQRLGWFEEEKKSLRKPEEFNSSLDLTCIILGQLENLASWKYKMFYQKNI